MADQGQGRAGRGRAGAGAGRTAALESKHNVTHKSVTYGRNSGVEAVRRAPQPGVRSRKGGLSHRNRYQPLDWRVSRTRLPVAKSGQTRMNFIFPPPCGSLPGKGITKQLPGSLRERPQRSPGSTPRRLPMAVPDRGGWASRPRSRRHGGSALVGDRQVATALSGVKGWAGADAVSGTIGGSRGIHAVAAAAKAGCPSGQRERSVKPSAQPTMVRIHHPPPPPSTCGNVS